MYVCMYVCMRARVFTFRVLHLKVDKKRSLTGPVCMHACMYVCVIYVCVHTCMCVSMRIYCVCAKDVDFQVERRLQTCKYACNIHAVYMHVCMHEITYMQCERMYVCMLHTCSMHECVYACNVHAVYMHVYMRATYMQYTCMYACVQCICSMHECVYACNIHAVYMHVSMHATYMQVGINCVQAGIVGFITLQSKVHHPR
jgi:hypothetical protein